MALKYQIWHTCSVRYSLGFLLVSWLMLLGAVTHTEAKYTSDIVPLTLPNDAVLPGMVLGAKITFPPALPTPQPDSPLPSLPVGKTIHVPVLMYHYIRYMYNPADKLGYALSVTPDNFEKQMAYLTEQGYTTITPDQLYQALEQNGVLPAKPILLTFDDGYKDLRSEALRIIEKYNVKATIFIPTDRLSMTNYMTWEDLHVVANDSHITIAGHTRHHLDLTTLPQAAMEDEIIQGKAQLERNLGRQIDYFAYPYGAFNDKVVSTVKNAGFKMAFSTIPNGIQSTGSVYALHRLNVSGALDLPHFAQLLNQ